jgi:quercetin dioxygenase-like cupin family protein
LRTGLQGEGEEVQETINLLEMSPVASVPWHMHAGAQELLYVIEGEITLDTEGRGTNTLNADSPADLPRLARNESSKMPAKALFIHSRSGKAMPLLMLVKQ